MNDAAFLCFWLKRGCSAWVSTCNWRKKKKYLGSRQNVSHRIPLIFKSTRVLRKNNRDMTEKVKQEYGGKISHIWGVSLHVICKGEGVDLHD